MERKKLYLSDTDKKLMGVCGGLGKYFNIDSTFIRIAFIILALNGSGVLAYFIIGLITPDENSKNTENDKDLESVKKLNDVQEFEDF